MTRKKIFNRYLLTQLPPHKKKTCGSSVTRTKANTACDQLVTYLQRDLERTPSKSRAQLSQSFSHVCHVATNLSLEMTPKQFFSWFPSSCLSSVNHMQSRNSRDFVATNRKKFSLKSPKMTHGYSFVFYSSISKQRQQHPFVFEDR